uniref:Protein kinase domain-containing protein n=1 Tax=Panagrolaimus sp. ES5 TaxID=591445 RepID=A0AC34GMY4_9BILA
GVAKIFDFGKSRDISKPTILPHGTFDAPEVINGIEAGAAADYFSLGCLVGFMLQKFPPFYDEDDKTFYKQIQNEAPKIEIADETAKDFVTQLLQKDPNVRLTKVLNHPYLKVSIQPIFAPGNILNLKQDKVPANAGCRSNMQGTDLVLSNGLLRFPTRRCTKWINGH